MPAPTNIKQVEAFIGKLNYYNKFIKNVASIAAPLNELRQKGAKFIWTSRQEEAFQKLKTMLLNSAQLVHYQDELPIILATDASDYGVGAVLSHRFPDGSERPISLASKTLSASQRNFGQIEMEALSIIYGVTKFHQYLYGREFELITDHKPLTTLFHPAKKLPVATLQRLQRWAIILQAYTYKIKYRSTLNHGNADALSRLPMGMDTEFDDYEERLTDFERVHQSFVNELPINSALIAKESISDSTLSLVSTYIKNGWPESIPKGLEKALKPYFDRKLTLSLQLKKDKG